MKIDEVIFTESLPKLDLHGFDRQTAVVAINDFINDNLKMGNEVILIIHGIGTGIIRNVTTNTLKKNKNVIEYKSVYNNRGCTIVQIKK
ncbi:MAG: Smr/MutS family protein [Bacilli bacterium]|nr:Smr/MutS family protein [Bacilli bacterium]